VTGSYPAPTWGHIDAFCNADGWEAVRETDHVFWEKTLPSGEVLTTHRSFAANKPITPNVFSLILREQLRVSKAEFWGAIASGEPVDRPVDLDDAPPEFPAWVVFGLRKYGYTEAEIRTMTPSDAQALLQDKWSSPEA
jgi:hypothetical protein